MASFTIDDVYPKGQGNPIVINFLNGYPTAAMKNVPCTVLQDRVTKEKTYACEIDGMLYTGKVVKEKHVETVLVKRNRITGRVAAIGTEYLEMKPELLPEVEIETDRIRQSDNFDFRSKNEKQRMIMKDRFKIDVQTVTEQMQHVADNLRDRQHLIQCSDNSEDFYIPPIDRTATNIYEVYDINKILTDEEFENIYTEIYDNATISDMMPWVQGLVVKKHLSSKHTVLAVYANCLLNLYSASAKEINKKKFLACPYSKSLNEIIIKNFISHINGKILRPNSYKDKSLCHAIVFILLVNDLKFELEQFCLVSKLSIKTASNKIRTTGATVVNKGGRKIVELKLPLKNKRGFRRRSAKF